MGGKRKRGGNKAVPNASQPTQKRPKTDHNGAAAPEPSSLALDKSPFTDESTGENRKREANIYNLLGSADSGERIAAADALITALLAGPESVLQRHLDKRLFRGLASSRNASRLGFSLVLAEILGQLFGSSDLGKSKFPGLTFDKVLNILIENTQASGNVPGQEERDFYFGRLFGIQCFVEAKILFEDETRWLKVLDLLLQMAHKKVWMRSHCGWVIVESLPQMGQSRAEETLKKLADIGLGKTAEGVGIWLRARTCYPKIKAPAKPWSDPLSPGVLSEVARVLKENVAQDTGGDAGMTKLKQSNWTAQLHFVWDLILGHFQANAATDSKHSKDHFTLFWSTVIDDGLFSKNASDGQKYRGFMIFQKFLLGFAPTEQSLAKELFTRNLMKCLMNQAAKEDRYLHRAAMKSLQCVERAVEQTPELQIPIIKELIGKSGAYDFDRRTNSKTVESLVQWTTPFNAKKVLKLLRDPVLSMKDDVSEIEKLRQAYADYVFKMTTHARSTPEAPEDADSKSALEVGIKELASCAYSVQEEFKPELSEKTRDIFRKRLASAFAKVTKQHDSTEYLCNAVASVKPTAVAMSEEVETERKNALKAMGKLLKSQKESKTSHAKASSGLALLYAATLLQLYDGAPDAISILQDLKGCSEKLKSNEEGASELLVEILLALVSRQSLMLRQISEQVFQSFTAQISPEALQLLTDPLLAEENAKGYEALFENADEEDVEMEDADGSDSDNDDVEDVEEDEISEIGSDVEFVTLNGAEPADDEDDDSGSDEEEDKEKAEAEAKELADLDDALAKVLKSHRLDKDKDAASSDEDSDMSDSEMMALDDKLVEVFKQRTKQSSKKKDRRDAKETITTLKHRVLDLLLIYVRHEAANPIAFGTLIPLLALVRNTSAKPLANKASGVLAEFGKAAKKTRANASTTIDADAQTNLLEEIHREAAKDASHAFARAASAASLLVASSLVAADANENAHRVNSVYATTFSACQLGKARIQGTFFSDWVNWGMGYANTMQKAKAEEEM